MEDVRETRNGTTGERDNENDPTMIVRPRLAAPLAARVRMLTHSIAVRSTDSTFVEPSRIFCMTDSGGSASRRIFAHAASAPW